jgi:hypothetical protein
MIILAFPGLGKTTLAKTQEGFVDLDFDYYRESGNMTGISHQAQLNLYAQMARRYDEEGFTVLLNEPEVLQVKFRPHVDLMILPEGKMIKRSATKLDVPLDTVSQWKMDWYSIANTKHLDIFFTHYYLNELVRDYCNLRGTAPYIPRRVEEPIERPRSKRE